MSSPPNFAAILQRVESTRQSKPTELAPALNEDEVRHIARALASDADTALAHLILTTLVALYREHAPKSRPRPTEDETTTSLSHLFAPTIDYGISSTSTADEDFALTTPALLLLSALFQMDGALGWFLLRRDGVLDTLADIPELFPSSLLVLRALANVLSQASGYAASRPAVKTYFYDWLEQNARSSSSDTNLRATAAVALTKLSRGGAAGRQEGEEEIVNASVSQEELEQRQREKRRQEEDLSVLMKGMILSDGPSGESVASSATLDAIEGLAYLSNESGIKETLASDSAFLKRLFALLPKVHKQGNLIARPLEAGPGPGNSTSTALMYGAAVIIANVVSFPPRLTEEETQMQKLRRMAKPGATQPGGTLREAAEEDPLESNKAVTARGQKLLKAGVLLTLASLARSESPATRQAVARSYLSLVEPRENRGQVMQGGGGKALITIIQSSLTALSSSSKSSKPSSSSSSTLPASDLVAIQALAKLSITADPRLLFGPSETQVHDVIRPFTLLLLHPESNLLQKFEALMGLTNLASIGPAISNRIATPELASKLDTMLLDDNNLVRRATTELLCNLITTETIFPRYSGENTTSTTPDSSTTPSSPAKAVTSRLHILLAFSDSPDVATRLAASGALAMLLSNSSSAVQALLAIEKGPKGVLAILADLIHPSPIREVEGDFPDDNSPPPSDAELVQLAHRGVVSLWGVLSNVGEEEGVVRDVVKAAREVKIADAVVRLIKPIMERSRSGQGQGDSSGILMPAAQSLQWLNEKGVEVVV